MPMSHFERITVWLTTAILTATTASGLIFYFQWQEMKGASVQTSQIIQESSKQVKATIDLAGDEKRYANAAEETLAATIIADRAWVGMSFIVPPFDLNTSGTITVIATNSGRSPALVTHFSVQEYAYDKFPKNPVYAPRSYGVTKPSQSLLMPNSQIAARFPTSTINQTTYQAIQTTRVHLYVYGKIEYTNIRTNTRHLTYDCVYWLPAMKEFQACPSYHFAD